MEGEKLLGDIDMLTCYNVGITGLGLSECYVGFFLAASRASISCTSCAGI